MENWLARLHTLAVNLSSGKRRGSRSWYSNVSPSAFSEILFFRAPKAPTVIARPNGPGGQGRDQQRAGSAKCDGPCIYFAEYLRALEYTYFALSALRI